MARRLIINCRQAHWLLSRQRDVRLHWFDRLTLRIHLRLCDWCSIVGRNFEFLSRAARRLDQ
ncbi:conserved hypothetical protein [Burkholderiales bacterium]|nr:conserved hypothetical protein [Burkholderiales bacterium]